MREQNNKTMKKVGLILGGVLLVLAVAVGAFMAYAMDYYKADETAHEVLEGVDVIHPADGGYYYLPSGEDSKEALVFYPGAKVETIAYLPLVDQIRDRTGMDCFLIEMPLHMAIFSPNAAEKVMQEYPEVEHWYLAGHSMGGAMASQFASQHEQELDGLILLGAYPYKTSSVDALTVYGSLNVSVAEKIDYTENVVVLEGGNHAQFGNYGPQDGDAPATITDEEQQEQTVDAIVEFVDAKRAA